MIYIGLYLCSPSEIGLRTFIMNPDFKSGAASIGIKDKTISTSVSFLISIDPLLKRGDELEEYD